MRLFKKNKKSKNISTKAATGIAKGILRTQEKISKYLDRFTANWKQKQQWIFLYFTCLLFGGLSVISIIKPFREHAPIKDFIPRVISVPKMLPSQQRAFVITTEEYQKLQEYKNAHPDLQRERPSLYDSLTIIEQAYYSQKK